MRWTGVGRQPVRVVRPMVRIAEGSSGPIWVNTPLSTSSAT